MEGIIKCDVCEAQFDVDSLQYEDCLEKFQCPECGSDKFKPLIEGEGVTPPQVSEKTKIPDMAGILRKMVLLMEEAHDQHIYAPDDEHPDDCRYCEAIRLAENILQQ